MLALAGVVAFGTTSSTQSPAPPATVRSAMHNPYVMTENWPTLGPNMQWGAAIGLIPDGKGGVWMHFRSEPAINHFDASGKLLHSFGEGVFVQAHGFCRDSDGNFWAGDSGPFRDDPKTKGRGFTMHKFSPDGKLLQTLGKPGVSKAGPDTFIGPTACAMAPNGDIIIAEATGLGRATRSRTAIAWCATRRTASSSARTERWAPVPASSWDRTRSPSIHRAGCSSPTAPTTASRSSTGT
jgi:hypothetical protein